MDDPDPYRLDYEPILTPKERHFFLMRRHVRKVRDRKRYNQRQKRKEDDYGRQ